MHMLESKKIYTTMWNERSCETLAVIKKNNTDMYSFLIRLLLIIFYDSTNKIQNNIKIGQRLFVL